MLWIKRVLVTLVAVVVLAVAVVYGGSEWKIRAAHAVPLEKIAVPTDAVSIAEGGRLAKIEGCRNCHGPDAQGKVLVDDPMLGRIASPALARIAATYSNEELARAVRHGVRKDGTTLWVMPTGAHGHIADDDMGRIIAWMRTLKPSDKDSQATMSFGPMGRALILGGMFPPSVRSGDIAEATRPAETGRYFVEAMCFGCHAMDKERPAEDGSGMVPPLGTVAPAYDLPGFKKLMRTGIASGNRKLGLMREIALNDGVAFSDAELEAILTYLKAEAAKQPPAK